MLGHIDNRLWCILDHIWDRFCSQWWPYRSFCFSSWCGHDCNGVWLRFRVQWVGSWCLRCTFRRQVWGDACCWDFSWGFMCLVWSSFRRLGFCFISPWCVRGRLVTSFNVGFWVVLSWRGDGFWVHWWFCPFLLQSGTFRVCSRRGKSQKCPF